MYRVTRFMYVTRLRLLSHRHPGQEGAACQRPQQQVVHVEGAIWPLLPLAMETSSGEPRHDPKCETVQQRLTADVMPAQHVRAVNSATQEATTTAHHQLVWPVLGWTVTAVVAMGVAATRKL